jgi:predicted glycoside hydrolase/deacetylase ChbG (UPF0249 family)
MKNNSITLLAILLGLLPGTWGVGRAQESAVASAGEIRLLVRADDMGSSHAANVACIAAYKEGIVRSVELMVPGPWFTEAVKMLNENPGLDVGIHLVLTSEWDRVKWGPKSCAPSLVDANGFFFPMVWKNARLPAGSSIQESSWRIEEVEQELRAQIEIALRNVPRMSHLSEHMGFESLDPAIKALVGKLRKEYRLQPGPLEDQPKPFAGWGEEKDAEARARAFVENLGRLTPGVYIFVEHPALDTPEMETVGHPGYDGVGADRDAVTKVLTHPQVKGAIARRGIKLIRYSDLR